MSRPLNFTGHLEKFAKHRLMFNTELIYIAITKYSWRNLSATATIYLTAFYKVSLFKSCSISNLTYIYFHSYQNISQHPRIWVCKATKRSDKLHTIKCHMHHIRQPTAIYSTKCHTQICEYASLTHNKLLLLISGLFFITSSHPAFKTYFQQFCF